MTMDCFLEPYQARFEAYADRYDREDGRVALKILHTRSVVGIMKMLCERRGLPERTTRLALLCALFHDIGRFEQLRQYHTFLDQQSCDHAALGVSVLQDEAMLESLPREDREKIFAAIANHNRYAIDPAIFGCESGDGPETLELCKLIRDADKCDIFRVFATEDMVDIVGAPESAVAGEAISPDVYAAFREGRCVEKTLRRTCLDFWVSFLAFFFDLNYPESAAIAKEQGYYRAPFDRVTFLLPETREQVREILDILELHIAKIQNAETVPAALAGFFEEHRRLALAFSGGADSAYLLYAAKACGCDVHAYYVSTPFQPQFEQNDARRLARELRVPMTVLPFDVLGLEAVRANPADRCYHCKHAIFHSILEAARRDGYRELADGTNASDDAGDRPGMRALREMAVLSPLRLCGVTKSALRSYSRSAGLFTWDKPAYACLATRVPTGVEIQKGMLELVEWAEETLSGMGFTDFRVRLLPVDGQKTDFSARLQVTEAQLSLVTRLHREIMSSLKPKFRNVFLDLETRSSSVWDGKEG